MNFEIHISTQQRQGPLPPEGELIPVPMIDGVVLSFHTPNKSDKQIWVELTSPLGLLVQQIRNEAGEW